MVRLPSTHLVSQVWRRATFNAHDCEAIGQQTLRKARKNRSLNLFRKSSYLKNLLDASKGNVISEFSIPL